MSRLPVLALTLLLLVGIGAAAQAAPIVINFDTLANGAVITNQYAGLGVVFSSVAGSVNYVTEQPIYNGTKPKFLCTGPSGGGINCTAETIVDFSTPVDDLTFQGLGINDTSTQVARIDIFQNAIYSATIIIPGASQDYDPLLLDLRRVRRHHPHPALRHQRWWRDWLGHLHVRPGSQSSSSRARLDAAALEHGHGRPGRRPSSGADVERHPVLPAPGHPYVVIRRVVFVRARTSAAPELAGRGQPRSASSEGLSPNQPCCPAFT